MINFLKILLAVSVFASTTVASASAKIQDFSGDYVLTSEVSGTYYCPSEISVTTSRKTASLVLNSLSVISAPVNGKKIKAGESSDIEGGYSYHSVVFEGGVLSFIFEGVETLMSLPVSRQVITNSISIQSNTHILLERKSFKRLVKGIGSTEEATCEYARK